MNVQLAAGENVCVDVISILHLGMANKSSKRFQAGEETRPILFGGVKASGMPMAV